MDVLLYLIPIALSLGALGLGGFFWALRHQQFDDPEGNAQRALFSEDDHPLQANNSDSINADGHLE